MRRVSSFVLGLAFIGAAAAQDLPTVDQILAKYVQALGGKENLEKLTTRVCKGTYAVPEWEAKGPHEIYAKAPNKLMNTTAIADWGNFRQGYNGAAGWSEDPDSGMRDLSGGELEQLKRNSEFNSELKSKEMYTKMTVARRETQGGADVYVIDAAQPDGLASKLYFDAQSGLLVRRDSQSQTPEGRITSITLFQDYRDVGGVKIPFTIEQNSPNMGVVITLDKVEHNVPVDDKVFEKPAGQ